jgi:glycolate oxidase FAD binding subunit
LTTSPGAERLTFLSERVLEAFETRVPLRIRGGDTKLFLAGLEDGPVLDMRSYAGIVDYAPSELVVTARAGTPLAELERALADRGQGLPFEPPRFADERGALVGTVGGMVAAGLAGPARPSAGGVRDHVLGALMINGRGEPLRFGGEVMKNVAGYDVARLLAGSWGALGAICEVSLKVLPMPQSALTLRFDLAQEAALEQLHAWAGQPLPLTASVWWRDTLAVRLRGARAAVAAAARRLGGETIPPELAAAFWDGLRDQRDDFFAEARHAVEAGHRALWRLSLPATTPPLPDFDDTLIEWGGAQRWVVAAPDDARVPELAARAGGSALRVLGGLPGRGAYSPSRLAPTLADVHRRLRESFDPAGIFVPGRPIAL